MIGEPVGIARIWEWLADVPDPEIPAVSVVDLGIVRAIAWSDATGSSVLKVTITPTYSGCPATSVIQRDIERALIDRGVAQVELDVCLTPAWTTDWLSDAARLKLRSFGIAPPDRSAAGVLDIVDWVAPTVVCPRCDSSDVEIVSRFGSTPCKALYRCIACKEPFDHFKCH